MQVELLVLVQMQVELLVLVQMQVELLVLLKNKKQNPQYMYMQLDKDIYINPPWVEIQTKQYL